MTTVPQHTSTIDGLASPAVTAIRALEQALNAQDTAGASGATFGGQGNIAVQTNNPGINPASTGADVVLAVATIPASAFDVANRSVTITANGSIVNNANNKRVKIVVGPTSAVVGSAVVGGTAIADSAVVTTLGGGWQAQASIYKYGAPGSNTQLGLHQQFQVGNAVSAMLAPSPLTLVENAPILVAITGNAGTTATDITFNQLELNWND